MELDWTQALAGQIIYGWINDAAAVMTIGGLAWLIQAMTGISRWVLFVPLGIVLWLASLANVLHFKYFGLRLDWWIVRLHWRDVGMVSGSATDLGATIAVVASIVFILAFLGFSLIHVLNARSNSKSLKGTLRLRRYVHSVMVLLSAVFLWYLPIFITPGAPGMILSDQIVMIWWGELTRREYFIGASDLWRSALPNGKDRKVLDDPTELLAWYRDYDFNTTVCSKNSALSGIEPRDDRQTKDPAWPLMQKLHIQADESGKLRKQLGYPEKKPMNVIILFVESMRTFELMHPELKRIIFPNLHRVLTNHGLLFTQAYSSALQAGQTVRGQFSTLCSMLPNNLGAASYIAHTTVRLHCLQEYLQKSGYHTIWMNSFESTYHSKRQFEILHGTESFYDGKYFRKMGISQEIGDWGLADQPFLLQCLKTLENLYKQNKKPIFANILTISSHHPHTVIPEGRLPDDLQSELLDHPEYHGYLSRLMYVDKALESFFDAFFQSSISKNTLVVLLGDHSTPVKPHVYLTDIQKIELTFRVPVALIGLNMPTGHNHDLVHQIDIAPTVARITGVTGDISWVGRGLLTGNGSPFVYQAGDRLYFRDSQQACYSLPDVMAPLGTSLKCYDVCGIDPLWEDELNTGQVSQEILDKIKMLYLANLQSIALNRILPAQKSQNIPKN